MPSPLPSPQRLELVAIYAHHQGEVVLGASPVFVALVVGGIATMLAMNISKLFGKFMSKVNYRILCLSIISLIVILCFFLSGVMGLFVLFVSTCVGIIPQVKGIGRNHMMGCLLLPVMLYFLI